MGLKMSDCIILIKHEEKWNDVSCGCPGFFCCELVAYDEKQIKNIY
jgi:hypothetical protein